MIHLSSQFHSVSHFPSQPQNGCQTSGDYFPEQRSSEVRKENSILLGVLLKSLKVFSRSIHRRAIQFHYAELSFVFLCKSSPSKENQITMIGQISTY